MSRVLKEGHATRSSDQRLVVAGRGHVCGEPVLRDSDVAQPVETAHSVARVGRVPASSRFRSTAAVKCRIVRCLHQPLLSSM